MKSLKQFMKEAYQPRYVAGNKKIDSNKIRTINSVITKPSKVGIATLYRVLENWETKFKKVDPKFKIDQTEYDRQFRLLKINESLGYEIPFPSYNNSFKIKITKITPSLFELIGEII